MNNLINGEGKLFLSRFKSSLGRSIGLKVKDCSIPKFDTPGPGSYRMPSEFGIYESKNVSLRESLKTSNIISSIK